jgi:hypothetical protein
LGDSATTVISSNIVNGDRESTGIAVYGNASVVGNIISGCKIGVSSDIGFSTIEKNLINNNEVGLVVGHKDPDNGFLHAIIIDNTISKNSIGINLGYYHPYNVFIEGYTVEPEIMNNNIQQNTNYSIYVDTSLPLTAINNWWGRLILKR